VPIENKSVLSQKKLCMIFSRNNQYLWHGTHLLVRQTAIFFVDNFDMTSRLENLEKVRNAVVVSEKSGEMEKSRETVTSFLQLNWQ